MKQIQELLEKTANLKNFRKELSLKPLKQDQTEFLILIKPEILFPNTSIENQRKVIETILTKIKVNNITVTNVSIFDGIYAIKNSILKNQYMVLHRAAIFGKFIDRRIVNWRENVISSYSFLKLFPEISSSDLEREAHLKGSEKVGNGLYFFYKEYKGKRYCIINAFHPEQINHFEKEKNRFVVLFCSTTTNSKVVHEDVIGYFNPAEANPQSIRGYLWKNKYKFKEEVSTLRNGVHVSPSTLEAIRNLNNYFSKIKIEDTSFYKKLNGELDGISVLAYLLDNPFIEDEETYLFDLIEGKDIDDMITFIKGLI